jgi:hypothetical protein
MDPDHLQDVQYAIGTAVYSIRNTLNDKMNGSQVVEFIQQFLIIQERFGISEEMTMALGVLIYLDNSVSISQFYPRLREFALQVLLNRVDVGIDFLLSAVQSGFMTHDINSYQFPDQLMTILLQTFMDRTKDSLKPKIIAVIGDIALVMQERFERYYQYICEILINAKQVCDKTDEEFTEEIIAIRESVLETSQSLIICSEPGHPVIVAFTTKLFDLLELYWQDDHLRSPRMEQCAISLLGFVYFAFTFYCASQSLTFHRDISLRQPQLISVMRELSMIHKIVSFALASDDASVQEAAKKSEKLLWPGRSTKRACR